ncbi:MAG: hypothetical protein EU532_14850 [Promethearchaeota archaeon]|nr:MAG: hypothetical protein EU532_14850 [Candidatus Lokiarchaeota archaeon]
MSNEGQFYDQLFESFNSLQNESNIAESWKIHQINKLMKKFSDKSNSTIIKNGLIVIMAIFDDRLKDCFYLKSRNVKNLNDNDKETICTILHNEFIS